jgi:serine/threonine protein kinase
MPRELAVGTLIGEYRVKRVLGQGGFGITYLAYDENLDRDVAIKEYFPREFAHRDAGLTVTPNQDEQDRADFEWGMKHFVEEARSLTRFKHKNIVSAIRFIRENGTAYLVMEYCDGESLESVARATGGAIPENVLLPIANQLLDGLDEVHSARLLHLDVKPSNIFLKKDGTVVLLDFGSARQAISSHTKSVKIASAGYGAIEQESADIDAGKLGPWTDVYGLGATLYRLMTGSRPQQATARLLQDTMPPVGALSGRSYRAGAINAVTRALCVKPQDRPQSTAEFRRLLNQVDLAQTNVKGEKDAISESPFIKEEPFSWTPFFAVIGLVIVLIWFAVNGSSSAPNSSTSDSESPAVELPSSEDNLTGEIPPNVLAASPGGVTNCRVESEVWTDCYGEFSEEGGVKYRGMWKASKRHGPGEQIFIDGTRYVGDFRQDKLHGVGEFYYPDGSRFAGQFRNGKRQGRGVLYAANGQALGSGTWDDDVFVTEIAQSRSESAISEAARAADLYIDVSNRTGYRILHLYVRPAGSSQIGQNRLGHQSLDYGQIFKVDLPQSTVEVFDVIACDKDKDEYELKGVNALTSDAVLEFKHRTYRKCVS